MIGQSLQLTETAYAKINLALHVRARRDDGYHELETLFAFADFGDELTADIADGDDSLTITGEQAAALDLPDDNIVSGALALLPREQKWRVSLDKRLPVAAGLGGGSADAAAIFRMVHRSQGLPANWRDLAASLGADVPACVYSKSCIGRGTGTDLEPIDNDMKGMPLLLVNPRVPLATGPVFKGWDGVDKGPLPSGGMRDIALAGRNDLQTSAVSICPEIRKILGVLDDTEPYVARMSGSGASCFAIYQRHDVMAEAVQRLRSEQPGWWVAAGTIR